MIFYLHVPKTGGQTLASRLASAFPLGKASILGGTLIHPQGVEDLRRMMSEYDFVESHLSGPVLACIDGLDILTTIRDPVSQIVSNYLHIRREPLNLLYRPASLLSPAEFFEQFGDFLANHQSRYLANACFELEVDANPLRTYSRLVWEALDRIRWVIPTESIDEFIPLWSIETGRFVPNPSLMVNVASKGTGYQELVDLVSSQRKLYSLDLLLWHAAQARFADYKKEVHRIAVPWNAPDDTSRAYWNGAGGIWLRWGWYPPQLDTPVGRAWWAGPEQYSEVAFRRRTKDRYLHFSVVVVCGVPHSQIIAVQDDKRTRLPIERLQVTEHRWDYWIDLEGLPVDGSFYLWVPEVWAPIMASNESSDTERKSFATCDWSFTPVPASSEGLRVGLEITE